MAEAASAPLVALDKAVVAYADGPALGPFDLTVAPGEIVAVVGASGAGKSTLLRLLCGLETRASGRAVSRVSPGRTGFVFQSPVLAPWSDTAENVALPLRLAGVDPREIRPRVQGALAAVGLGGRADARPRELSGGMAMRASLARALITDPELLLLDEPFAALDTVTRRRMAALIHDLWATREPRPAIVFVTHDIEEAVHLAGRVVVLGRGGEVIAEHPCPGVLPRPNDWRASSVWRATVEAVAADLARTMEAA